MNCTDVHSADMSRGVARARPSPCCVVPPRLGRRDRAGERKSRVSKSKVLKTVCAWMICPENRYTCRTCPPRGQVAFRSSDRTGSMDEGRRTWRGRPPGARFPGGSDAGAQAAQDRRRGPGCHGDGASSRSGAESEPSGRPASQAVGLWLVITAVHPRGHRGDSLPVRRLRESQ
jgi:hypothetical protein